jgi:hypothetical protein
LDYILERSFYLGAKKEAEKYHSDKIFLNLNENPKQDGEDIIIPLT